MNNNNHVSASLDGAMCTLGLITWIVFLIIKCTANPDWLTWFWVWFPLWLPWALVAVEVLILGIIILVLYLIDRHN